MSMLSLKKSLSSLSKYTVIKLTNVAEMLSNSK